MNVVAADREKNVFSVLVDRIDNDRRDNGSKQRK